MTEIPGSTLAPLGIHHPPTYSDDTPEERRHWASRKSRYTYFYHRFNSIFHGGFLGLYFPMNISLFTLYLLESGENEKLYSTIITSTPTLAMIFAPLFMWRSKSGERNYWLFAGIFGILLPSLCFGAISEAWQVVILLGLSRLALSGLPTARNSILYRNYDKPDRERFYGKAKLYHISAYVLASLILNWLLDRALWSYRIVFPLGGTLCFLGALVFYRVKRRPFRVATEDSVDPPYNHRSPPAIVYHKMILPFINAIKLLASNKEFRIYEVGFFLYGMAFMMLMPFVPIFYKNNFNVTFMEFWQHSMLAFQGTMFLCHWLLRGRHGRWTAPKTAAVGFIILVGYPSLLMVAGGTDAIWFGLIGFIVYGVGMTFVDYAWNLGPPRFAKGGDPMPFSSAHVMMTGLRALIAYPTAFVLMTVFENNYMISLSVPLVLFVVAGLIMFGLDRKIRRAKKG